jgi:hypothetical protein
MKVIIIIFILYLANCKVNMEEDIFDKNYFKPDDSYEQISRKIQKVNSLSKVDRIKFFKLFLVGKQLSLPPNEIMVFKENGELEVESLDTEDLLIFNWIPKEKEILIRAKRKKDTHYFKEVNMSDIKIEDLHKNTQRNGKNNMAFIITFGEMKVDEDRDESRDYFVFWYRKGSFNREGIID